MDRSVAALILMAATLVLGVAAVLWHNWRERVHARLVAGWVHDYLLTRFSMLPANLHINCPTDRRWPVLVDFDYPGRGVRYGLQFTCPGPQARFALLSEKDHER